MPRTLLLLAAGCLVLTACASEPVASVARAPVPPEIAQQRNPVELTPSKLGYYQTQFRTKCARCHGATGDGGGPESAIQEVPPADLTDATYMATRTDGELFHQILVGGGERCAMPAFGPGSAHGWSEEKIWYMVAFVRRLASPTPAGE